MNSFKIIVDYRLVFLGIIFLITISNLFAYIFINRNKNGLYINIGNHASNILMRAKIPSKEKLNIINSYDTKQNCYKIKNYKTTLESPTKEDFEMILRHGYENAKYSYVRYLFN